MIKSALTIIIMFTSLAFADSRCEDQAANSYTGLARQAAAKGLLTPQQVFELSQSENPIRPTFAQGRDIDTLSFIRGFDRAYAKSTPASWAKTREQLRSVGRELSKQEEMASAASENTALVFSNRTSKPFPVNDSNADENERQIVQLNTRDGRTLIAHYAGQQIQIRDLGLNKVIWEGARTQIFANQNITEVPLLHLHEGQKGQLLLDFTIYTSKWAQDSHHFAVAIITLDIDKATYTRKVITVSDGMHDWELHQARLDNGSVFYILGHQRYFSFVVIHPSGEQIRILSSIIAPEQFAVSATGTSLFSAYLEDGSATIYEFGVDGKFKEIARFPYIKTYQSGVLVGAKSGPYLISPASGFNVVNAKGNSLATANVTAYNQPQALHETKDGHLIFAVGANQKRRSIINFLDVRKKGDLITSLPVDLGPGSLRLKWTRLQGRDYLIAASTDGIAVFVVEGRAIHPLGRAAAPFLDGDGDIRIINGAETPFVLGRPAEDMFQAFAVFSRTDK